MYIVLKIYLHYYQFFSLVTIRLKDVSYFLTFKILDVSNDDTDPNIFILSKENIGRFCKYQTDQCCFPHKGCFCTQKISRCCNKDIQIFNKDIQIYIQILPSVQMHPEPLSSNQEKDENMQLNRRGIEESEPQQSCL